MGSVNCLLPDELKRYITPTMAALLSISPGAGPTDKGCIPAEVVAKYAPADGLQPDLEAVPPGVFSGCSSTDSSPFVVHVRQRANDGGETWVMLDLIGAAGVRSAIISIDELPVWVVALDGNYIEPVLADALPLFMGQRYTVLVKMAEPKKYTIRISGPGDTQIIYGSAVLDFQIDGRDQSTESSQPSIDILGRNLTADVVYYNGVQAAPLTTPTIPRAADATYKMTMQADGALIFWALNTSSRLEDKTLFEPPLLFEPRPELLDNYTITIPSSHKWVDFIFLASGLQPNHPIHMHGRHFYVLGAGKGTFPWDSVEEAVKHLPPGTLNLHNPQLRDTFDSLASMDGPTWLALRRPSDNKGAWLIHCHLQTHLQGGMAMVVQDGIEGGIEIPRKYREWQCAV
jgi:FtsP/CotA-like multicopper oxidase with cupredoxin domain